MRAISNAFFREAEIVQPDRWQHGPLELALVNVGYPGEPGFRLQMALHEWNQSHAAGSLRPAEAFDAVTREIPGIEGRRNPNIIVVPRDPNGTTELHVMLASLLPDEYLARSGLERLRANMPLMLVGRHELGDEYNGKVEDEFSRYIWRHLAQGARRQRRFFSARSSLRILSGDIGYWMNRIYRVALERWETLFTPTSEEPHWVSLKDVEDAVVESVGAEEARGFVVRRPLKGGELWLPDDCAERDEVIQEALGGAGVMDSLHPVIELLNTQHAHEDFSAAHSWIKEDFERSFYSKRARLKVEMIESIDDVPVWDANECDGYRAVLDRDLMAVLDPESRTLLLAIRSGKTICELARDEGLAGHASMSRRVRRLKSKIQTILK